MSEDYMEEAFRTSIEDVEKRIGRPMTETQKQGIRNTGSLMFWEAVMNGFWYAKNDEEIEAWLKEIDGFTRE
jgi:hypothetical protein